MSLWLRYLILLIFTQLYSSDSFHHRHRHRRCSIQHAHRSYDGVPIGPPPDLPSLLLSERIIYVGTPITSKISELIIAQLLYLDFESSTKPITLYINSMGSENLNGESIAFETDTLALIDVMNYVISPIQTVCIGQAFGMAAVILACGDKNLRSALPNSTILLKQASGALPVSQASDIALAAKEKLYMRNEIVELLSNSSGKSKQTVLKDIDRNKYLTAQEALKYGLIDNVLTSRNLTSSAPRSTSDYQLFSPSSRTPKDSYPEPDASPKSNYETKINLVHN